RDVAGSMSMRFWTWWGRMQPQGRVSEDGTLSRAILSTEDWDEVGKTHGRNGMLLVVGCLLWWGDAAAATEDESLLQDWVLAVRDVTWALGEAMR
ncbi:hypothetical protein C8R43DRAFT_831332, partial [Mycena crocata]